MPTYLSPGVYVEEMPSGSMPLSAAGTAVAAFVGYTAKAPIDDLENDPDGLRPRMVTNWTQYKKHYGGFTDSALLPNAVHGFFLNGGSRCYIVRIPHRVSGRAEVTATVQTLTAIDPPNAAESKGELEFRSLVEDGTVTIEIIPTPTPKVKDDQGNETDGPVPTTFDVKVTHAGKEEPHEKLTLEKGARRNVADVINSQSAFVEVITRTDTAVALAPSKIENLPAQSPYPKPPAQGEAPLPEAGLKPVTPELWEGSADRREGITGLVIADDVTMVMVPDLHTMSMQGGEFNEDTWNSIQAKVVAHCERERNRMAILDTPPHLTPQQARDWTEKPPGIDSKFAALYYPWLKITDPADPMGTKTKLLPPCGHMAGIWTRTDQTRGVWKAPANEMVLGVLNVEQQMTVAEQDILNPIGVNAIRGFGSRGIKVWGARTLSKTDPSWRYINVRRLFNMIEQTIVDGTQWVVFEPNDQALWQRVNRTVYSFLLGLWREGALFGATPEQAFFVKCDGETNPPESIDEGKLIVEVGIAPVKPAEFVIFRISQKALEAVT